MNTVRLLLFVALCGIVSAGCRSPVSSPTSPAVGVWMAPGPEPDEPALMMHFKADGTFAGQADEAGGGSYTTTGENISGFTEGFTFIGTIDGDIMHVTDSEGNKMTLTRQ